MSKVASQTFVLLLRGINVGGKNMLPMVVLRDLVESLGGDQVRTYIQSGNVIFSASATVASKVADHLSKRIADKCKLQVPVVMRSAIDIARIANAAQLGALAEPTESLFVGFCQSVPTRRAVAALDPKRSPGDSFKVIGGEVYLQLPSGAARTKLTTAYFDAKLDTVTTFRNWKTVQAIAKLAGE